MTTESDTTLVYYSIDMINVKAQTYRISYSLLKRILSAPLKTFFFQIQSIILSVSSLILYISKIFFFLKFKDECLELKGQSLKLKEKV